MIRLERRGRRTERENERETSSAGSHLWDCVQGGSDNNNRYGNGGRNLIQRAEAEVADVDEDADEHYYPYPFSRGGPSTLESSIAVRGVNRALHDRFCLCWDDDGKNE